MQEWHNIKQMYHICQKLKMTNGFRDSKENALVGWHDDEILC